MLKRNSGLSSNLFFFSYLCGKERGMEEYKIINYSNIFLTYLHETDRVCTFTVKDHTLFYLHSGEMEIEENGRFTRFHEGECAFVRKDNRVSMHKHCAKDGKPYISVALAFSRNFLMDYYRKMDKDSLPTDAKRSKASVLKIPVRPDVVSLFESIRPYYDSLTAPDEEWIKLKINEGLRVVLKTDKNVYASLFDFTEPWKIDLMAFMNENYMYDLSMKELANYTGRSLSTFKRDFKKVTNTSPQKWLIDKRLSEAHRMLSEGKRKIQDVAMEVGFSGVAFFSRSYKAKFGYSPASTESAL